MTASTTARDLSRVLTEWKRAGWERAFGRPPTSEELMSPSPTGRFLADPNVLERFHADLETLGFRDNLKQDAHLPTNPLISFGSRLPCRPVSYRPEPAVSALQGSRGRATRHPATTACRD